MENYREVGKIYSFILEISKTSNEALDLTEKPLVRFSGSSTLSLCAGWRTMDCWAINIDIEGFSILWDKEDQVLWSLGELMRAIFRIGRNCFPQSPERLFAHQLGDGFLIVSDFGEENLERCINIASAIMQHVAASGRLTKTAIAEGESSDIQGCYPREVLDELEADHTVSLRMGLRAHFVFVDRLKLHFDI